MQILKKYGAVLFLILVFPAVRFIANNLVLESSDEIYAYIPQESDFVIEVNTRNFITEIGYQRIFEEEYVNRKLYPETEEEPKERYVETGLNLFEKVILFREQWSDESIWIAVMKYTDEEKLKHFILSQVPEAHFVLNDDYAIIQLSESTNQENLNEHLNKISKKEVKAFSERINLSQVFNPQKEINCYIIPENTPYNQLIDGYLAFDFLPDHIAIEGSFTPIAEFNEAPPIAYALNQEKAFSMRSSLNLINSIYWFNKEKIENVPEYSQMAFDYDGVDCHMVNRNAGYSIPFKSYPKIDMHFDVLENDLWYSFFDSLQINRHIAVDTAKSIFVTSQGAFFSYSLTDQVFELKQNSFKLVPSDQENLYFDLRMLIDPMIENTTFFVDEQNPPSQLEQRLGMMVAHQMMDEIRLLANMEWVEFQLTGTDDNLILANGRVEMKDKTGQSMIESLSLGTTALSFIKSY